MIVKFKNPQYFNGYYANKLVFKDGDSNNDDTIIAYYNNLFLCCFNWADFDFQNPIKNNDLVMIEAFKDGKLVNFKFWLNNIDEYTWDITEDIIYYLYVTDNGKGRRLPLIHGNDDFPTYLNIDQKTFEGMELLEIVSVKHENYEFYF